jgi:hypothetical protein
VSVREHGEASGTRRRIERGGEQLRLVRACGSRVAVAVCLVVPVAAGCSSVPGHGTIDPITAYFGPGGTAIATADQPAGTAVTSAAQAARLLLTQFPTSVPGVPGPVLATARDIVVRALSRLHADPRWLCGGWIGKDPLESEFPPGGRWMRDPKLSPYRKHQVMYQLPGCDQARLSAVYVGDQQFTVARDGEDVRVQHTGAFTYDTRALGNGVRLPVHAVARRTFVIHRFGDGWHLSKVINAATSVAPGYGKALPRYNGQVPGLQQANQVGTADPAGAQAVRTALEATIGAGSAKIAFEDRSIAPWRLGGADVRTGQMWPKAGAAEYRYAKPAGKPQRYGLREFFIGKVGDYREYNVADDAGHRYTQYDPRLVPEVAGIPADSNPFAMLAVVAQLDSASPTACQSADHSQTCYVAHIPVSRLAVTGTLATRVGFAYASYGFTDLTLKVGLSGGRVSLVSQDAIMPVLGHGVLAVHWRFGFTGYADSGTPPNLVAPPAAQVAQLD